MKRQVMKKLLSVAWLVLTPAVYAAIEADVACSYAPSYASSVGGEDNAQVLIANAVVGNNVINDQSGTGAHMRIAGFYQSANELINATTTGGIVGWLSSNNANIADVVAFSTAVGSDLLVYVCQCSDSGSIAGVSQQPGRYSALNPGAVWYVVLAHETGGHAYGRSHSDGLVTPKTVMMHNYCSGGAAPPYYFTNPNLWFNGVQLLGNTVDNCSMGALVNGGDNSSLSAQAVADRSARVVAGPNLNNVVRHWLFTNAPGAAPASTTNLDLVAGAPAVVRGVGATYTGRALRIPGGTTGNVAANSIAAYIDLPNGIISTQTNLTLEIWATPLSAPNWARLFDFGRPTQAGDGLGAAGEYTGTPGTAAPGTTASSDDIMLSTTINTDLNQQRFEAKLNGTATTLDAALSTTAGVQHYYAVTFTDGAGTYTTNGGRWQWFRDGDAVAFLDVSNHLAVIEDVNNWLGRSMWSGDNMANCDYAEVRLSSVALARGEILANYLLGPNYVAGATVTLTNSDADGATSFTAAGQWSNGAVPTAGNSYETYDFLLRTPVSSSAATFGGSSLKLSGGSLLYKGTAASTITVNSLQLNGGAVTHAGTGICTLAGNILVTTNAGTINGVNGAINLTASLSGGGPLTFLANAVTLAGANSAFTGKILIGNGMAGTVVIDSQARLGTSPTVFTADQVTFNRGTLQTTATLALNDTKRGFLMDVSGGTFNVAAGTTLTLANTLSSPPATASFVAGSLTKTGAGTLVLNSPSNTFKGTLFVDTGSTTANDGVVKVSNNLTVTNAHSPIFIRNNNSGMSTLQLDGSGGNLTLPQAISLNGRTVANVALQNLSGANTIGGGITLNMGGSFYVIQADAGQLNLGGLLSSVATGARTYTFQGAGNHNVTGVITNGLATVNVSKTGTGTLTLAGTNVYSGTTTVAAGTLLVNGVVGAGAVTVGASATLGGKGLINGPVTVQSGGLLSPGTNAVGRLVISNALTLAAGSTTRIEISKTGSVVTNDVVAGLTSLACGGTITVTNAGVTALAAGDTFRIFAAAGFSGAFATTNLPALAANLYWVDQLAVDGTLAVAATVSVVPTNLLWSVSGANLTLEWPTDHIGWRLVRQTNHLEAGLSTDTNDWMTVPGSETTNLMNLLIDPTVPGGFYRMIWP